MIQLRWLGTAGFEVKVGPSVFLIDPFLSRGLGAEPVLPLQVQDINRAQAIFITHGHVDHAYDAPALAARTGATVYASASVCDMLQRKEVPASQLHALSDGKVLDLGWLLVTAIQGLHVRFDLALILRTFRRANLRLLRLIALARDWPCGDVLAYLFRVGDFTICHFGSAGYLPERIQGLGSHLALIPLGGHSHIHHIAAQMVALLQPQMVIPHHYDNPYPPITSKDMAKAVEPFVEEVGQEMVKVLEVGEEIEYEECEPCKFLS